mmetsp:Transcript_59712/g.182394  ORF Transcript_59712/g.182394 Transcript_59712/m.182394 type:complete len:701 (-) Transcript_59712:148-2250(-)
MSARGLANKDLSSDASDSDSDGSLESVQGEAEASQGGLYGCCFVPVDFVIEHVRSQGIQFFVALILFYRFGTHFILKGFSFNTCIESRTMDPCELDDDSKEYEPIPATTFITFFVLTVSSVAILLIGASNSRHFTTRRENLESCSPSCIWAAKIFGLFMCLCLVLTGQTDNKACLSGNASPLDYCLFSVQDPIEALVLGVADADLANATSGMIPALDSVMNSKSIDLICRADVETFVGNIQQDPSWCSTNVGNYEKEFPGTVTRCQSLSVSEGMCACKQVAKCYMNYKARVGTQVTVIVNHILQLGLLMAILWDMFGAWAPENIASYVNRLEWLSRPFIISISLSWLLAFGWCMGQAYGSTTQIFNRALVAVLPLNGTEKQIIQHTGTLFFWTQFLAFTVACAYNFRKYVQHSTVLEKVPWKFLKTKLERLGDEDDETNFSLEGHADGDKAGELAQYVDLQKEASDVGLNLDELRSVNWMSMGYYFGVAWASMMLGSFVVAVMIIIIVVVVWMLLQEARLRLMVWDNLLYPITRTVCAVVLLQLIFLVLQRCLWGPGHTFPRRPALLANVNLMMLLLSMQASFILGLSRLVKSFVPSTIGMMIVTGSGASPSSFLKDSLDGFYLSNLRMQRYHQAIEQGEITDRNKRLGCPEHRKDFGWSVGTLCGASLGLILAVTFVAVLFGENWEKAFGQGWSVMKLF